MRRCVIKKPQERGGHGPRWAAAPQKGKKKKPCVSNLRSRHHLRAFVKLSLVGCQLREWIYR